MYKGRYLNLFLLQRLADAPGKGQGLRAVAVNANRIGLDGNILARRRTDLAFGNHRQYLPYRRGVVCNHGVRLRPRRQRPVFLIGPVGEYLAGRLQSRSFPGFDQPAAGQAEQHQLRVDIVHGLGNRFGHG